MEVVTIVIGVVIFVISVLMLYCITAISMREKTFEEVMAEQRQREEEEKEKIKAEKRAEREQQKKKYKKGKHEKVKEKSAQVLEPELKVDRKVSIEVEPEIIEPVETLDLIPDLRYRGKKEKPSKPILHNKGEHTPVSEKATELPHKVVPKDELELKRSHEKVVVEKSETMKPVYIEPPVESESKTKHSAEAKENLSPKKVEKEEERKTKQRTDDVEKQPAKSKVPADGKDGSPKDGAWVISTVKQTKLTDGEVQTLIDILLSRQGLKPGSPAASASWNKKNQKGDPVALLKKQLEEKEKALQEEQSAVVSANTRVKELRNELQAEKNKHTAVEKKLQEKIGQQESEIGDLLQRVQHADSQHRHETSALQTRITALEQGSDKATIQKLSELNKALQENLSQTASENARLNQASEAAKALESKVSQYEEKIHKLEAAHKEEDLKTQKQKEEITRELQKAEVKITSLLSDLQKANSSLSTAQAEVNTLRAKVQEMEAVADAGREFEARLHESEQKCFELEGNVKNLDKQLADLSHVLGDSEAEIKRLQQENKALLDENKIISEQLQATPAANGDIHENGHSVSLAEHERIILEKSSEITGLTMSLETQKKTSSSLQSQLEIKALEVTELQDQLNLQKKKNNELRERNWKVMEALEKTEKSTTERVNKALEAARKEVDSKAQKQIEEISRELQKAEALLSDVQKVNSSLSTAQLEVNTLKAKLQELETYQSSTEIGREVEESRQKYSNLESSAKNLEKQLADLSLRLSDRETEISRLQQENRALSVENKTMSERLQTAPATNGNIHENGPSVSLTEHGEIDKSNEINDLTTSLEAHKKTISSLQSQLDTKSVEVSELLDQLNQQKKKNNELRERNWKVMEALQKSEKSATERVDRALKSAKEQSGAGSAEIEAYDKSVLQRLFPDVQISDKLPHKEWMHTFEKQAGKKVSNQADSAHTAALEKENERLKNDLEALRNDLKPAINAEKYTELENDNHSLKSEVENYKGIVTEAENKLRQLEKSIENEEKKWLEKLKQVHSQQQQDSCSSTRIEELQTLISQQKSQIEAYRHVLSDADYSLKELERKIEAEDKVWQEKLQQLQLEISQMRVRIEDQDKELKETHRQTVVMTQNKDTQLIKICMELEKEQKINKDLSLNIVKLNKIIQTGQDALSEEQDLVKNLQETLHSHSQVASGENI